MSRVRKGAVSEGNGSTPQEESGIDKKLEILLEKISSMEKCFDKIEERLTRIVKACSAGQAGVQTEELPETSTQRHGASKDGVSKDTPQTGTQMLQGKGQPSTGHHGDEQDQVPASRPGFYDEKGSEPGGESIRGELVKDTAPSNPSEPQSLHMYQQQTGRHYKNIGSIVRPVEGDHNRDACPDGSALRDPPCGKGLDVEPVPRSTGFEDGEEPVKQEEATTASPNIEQGWRNSSKVAVVNATTPTANRTVQPQHVLRNRTGVKTPEENKFFDPGGKQVIRAQPSKRTPLSGRA